MITEGKDVIGVSDLVNENSNIETKRSFFTNRHTNVAKGIALLLLLFHHLGLNPELGLFKNESGYYIIAKQCKVCVSIFLILSGYGLNASLNNKKIYKISDIIKFSFRHLIKLLMSYWKIFIIFVIFGCATGKRTLEIYGVNKWINLIIDFFGLADLFSTPTYNATWWFMSLIIIIYMLFPVLKVILKKSPLVLLIIGMSLRNFDLINFYPEMNKYIIVFCLGMIFSEYNIFDKLNKLSKLLSIRLINSIMFLIFAIYSRYKIGGIYDIVAAFSIIFISNTIFCNIKGVSSILEILGKNSGNIFMFHTFIYKYFFNNEIAKLNSWILMYIVLIVSTLLISIIIDDFAKGINLGFKSIKQKLTTLIKLGNDRKEK